ncbi:MAG: hypothetical protein PHP45_08300 [Elusimicrobiales bacterium]|nr:hypothetical protein [Elusimicrobiales bacterium]
MKSHANSAVFIGIDRGGTWVRFCGLDARLRRVFSERHPSPLIEDFPALIRKVLDEKNVPRSARCLAATKGAWTEPRHKDFIRKALKNRLAHVGVISDMEASLKAALAGKPGIAVLAGTGAVVFGMNAKGETLKSGGLGPQHGDEGSAYNVASVHNIILTGKTAPFDRAKVSKTASGARNVLSLAKFGDTMALSAVTLGRIKLAGEAARAVRGLGLKSPLRAAYDGSMMKDDFYRAEVFALLKIYTGIRKILPVAAPDSAPWCAHAAAGTKGLQLWKKNFQH